jgi:nucleoredoxin
MKHLLLSALVLAAASCAYAGAFDRGHATADPAAAAPAAAAPSTEPGPGLDALFGSDLLTDKGEPAPAGALEGKTVAIYFSASWCPPCRAFSPRLVDIADKLRDGGKPFELVLVGCDQTKQKSIDYMSSHDMKGYLIAPEADANKSLSKRYRVSGIPYLVVVDPTGRTIDPAARATVQSSQGDPDAVWSKWSP